jgi:hypothetical protein
VVFIADDSDDGGPFAADSDAVAALLPTTLQVTKAYLDDLDSPAVRQALLDAFCNGALLANYIGHGGVDQLGAEGLLTKADVPVLRAAGHQLPVFAAFTCMIGSYGIPGYDGLGESLVRRADAGAIAAYAPSAMEENEDSVRLDSLLMKKLFGSSKQVVLGKTILATQKAAGGGGVPAWVIQTYNLLGDPCLRLLW